MENITKQAFKAEYSGILANGRGAVGANRFSNLVFRLTRALAGKAGRYYFRLLKRVLALGTTKNHGGLIVIHTDMLETHIALWTLQSVTNCKL